MSYAIYTTRAWILASAPTGEASKLYWIYTEDFGLVAARAQSIRLLSSKLRYNLEEYSFASVSLVRGKEFWRITGAQTQVMPAEHIHARARVLTLVRRLVHGEERNAELFSALMLLGDAAESADESIFELIVVCRVLSSLGYIDAQRVLGSDKSSIALLESVKAKQNEVVSEINRALRESQL